MKSLGQTFVILTVLAAPVVSFAQSNSGVTPEQVRAELIQLEQAGYRPGDGDNTNYPADIQAAEARVAAQNGASGYGGMPGGGASASGAPTAGDSMKPIYFGQ
ncbi:DUF4148 domain-containing protein [Paraburkholderia sp. CNPSo 3274]|uniref:DUF4148 domain-containing protein n=1 Tax=Paraburkholderia sp. CNPSo 3274 TaxID=2940932 RepID=UPI0020B698E1|nr:DUF4148 domain-containing protein [Paraburkholderia sp. CNPSo 3274]MCP3707724.1 DUF4148 domain-containing protein [Paraburkholderia sp. CNPSo 3274]